MTRYGNQMARKPSTSDISLDLFGDTGWRIVCPPRLRGRHGFHAAIGLFAGMLLALVGITGTVESFAHPAWGARLFLLGWLVPLGVIGVLIVWFGARTLSRLWQVDIIQSDGIAVQHFRTGGPFRGTVLFEHPAERVEPFTTAIPQDSRRDSTISVPLPIRYRPRNEETVYEYTSLPSITSDEYLWLAETLNPLIERMSTDLDANSKNND